MPKRDSLPLKRIDHVRFCVGNAKQSAYFYRGAFGFKPIAYSGLETRNTKDANYVLRQGGITFVLSSPLGPRHPYNRRLARHGDGVMDIALEVDDVPKTYKTVLRRGAVGVVEPTVLTDDTGTYEYATIEAFGDTTHSFINRSRYHGVFAPTYKAFDPARYSRGSFRSVGLQAIDHMVINVPEGEMEKQVAFYNRIFGFENLIHFDDKDISTEYSALMSKVVQDGNGRIKFPINEPAKGLRRSQIEEYVEFYRGPGIQHIAMSTKDIVQTVAMMRHNEVSFLRVPQTYYDMLPERVGRINEDTQELAELGILVDRDEEGYMLQIFTKPVEDRPTLFFEVIERHGSKSFGKGNFKALFQAIEREQAERGTL